MPRTFVSAFLYATAIELVISAPAAGCSSAPDKHLLLQQHMSCAPRDAPEESEYSPPCAMSSALRLEADETSMLQQPVSLVRMAAAKAKQSVPSANDVFAGAQRQHKEEAGEEIVEAVNNDSSSAPLATSTKDSAEVSALLMHLSSWLSGVKAFKEHALMTLSSRRQTGAVIHLSSVDPETTQQDDADAVNATSGHTHLLLLAVAVPLVGLGVALCVTKVLPGIIADPASAISRNVSGSKPGSKASAKSGLKASSSVPKPQSNVRISAPTRVDESHSAPVHSPELFSTVARPPPATRPPAGLLPELTVPDGHECILGIPSLAGAAPDERTLWHVTDKDGHPLLYVGLTRSPSGGEYVALAKMDKQEIAFCETGSAVRAEGWAGKIFRWDGALHARLREAEDEHRSAAMSGRLGLHAASDPAHFAYVVLSAAGPPWQLRVTGNFMERKVNVEDCSRRLVATTSPVQDPPLSSPADDGYMLRLGPRADACAIVVAVLAIQRLVGLQEGGPPPLPPGFMALRGLPPPTPPPPCKRLRPSEFEL